jgi:hypothetical protein
LELILQVGAEVPTERFNVDVKLGVVKAYTDTLSAQYAGANGAHRMKEAFAIVNIGIEDKNEKDIGVLTSVSDPHPVVEIDEINSGDVTSDENGIMSVKIVG